ncbi:SDR family oxidoreductase [Brevibacterium mcbrellneri]|nr:SDR family oxidoreductase [Brevibacterium mcbrellneri]
MKQSPHVPSGRESLAGKRILMSGGSRGIGLAIAKRAAQDGAQVSLLAKTDTPDPRIPGTIHTAVQEIEEAGGTAHPYVGDVRDIDRVQDVVKECAEAMDGIDIVVNNASAIDLRGFSEVPNKRWALMKDINIGGTLNLISSALPTLLESSSPRVLTLSPPINLNPTWLGAHAPYTVSKYGMSILALGLAEEQRANPDFSSFCLWPRTLIATAAVANIVGGEEGMRAARLPQIMADAAYSLLTRPAADTSGRAFIDEEVLREDGVTDLSEYAAVPGTPDDQLETDLFLD